MDFDTQVKSRLSEKWQAWAQPEATSQEALAAFEEASAAEEEFLAEKEAIAALVSSPIFSVLSKWKDAEVKALHYVLEMQEVDSQAARMARAELKIWRKLERYILSRTI